MGQGIDEALTLHQPIDYIHSFHEAMTYRKEEVSVSHLMGVSGEAFRFFYNRFDPEAGMNTFLYNPLRATCKALGFNHEVLYDETYQAAWKRLKENIHQGKPALLPFPDSCPFLTEGNQPETVICQNGTRYEFTAEDLREHWQTVSGFLELGPNGYYQFIIGEREREPKTRDTILGAFRCASKLTRTRRRVKECAVGLAAYEELIAHLNSLADRKRRLTENEIYKVARWNGQPLQQCIEGRKAAIAYLESVRAHLETEEIEHLDKAIVVYKTVVELLAKLQTVLPAASLLSEEADATVNTSPKRWSLLPIWSGWRADSQTKARRHAIKRFKPNCHAAVKLLEKIVAAEAIGIESLENIVRISEKVKM
jgi:hypothetical protein